LRHLIDPNEAEIRLPPHNGDDLIVGARNSHILAFDNMSHISDWLSVLDRNRHGIGTREELNTQSRPTGRTLDDCREVTALHRELDELAELPDDGPADVFDQLCPFDHQTINVGNDWPVCGWEGGSRHELPEIPAFLEESPLPEPVQKIWRYCLDNKCDVIFFDLDGGDLDGDFEVFGDEDGAVTATAPA
jgi:hypothetical protein